MRLVIPDRAKIIKFETEPEREKADDSAACKIYIGAYH